MTITKKPVLQLVSKEANHKAKNKSPKISLVDLLKFAEGVTDIENGQRAAEIKVAEISSFGTANQNQDSKPRKADG